MPGNQRIVLACFLGIACWFVLRGLMIGNIAVQVVLIILSLGAAVLVAYRPTWGAYAAMSVFAFLTWLFLIAGGITGIVFYRDYSVLQPMTLATAAIIVILSLVGFLKSIPLGRSLSLLARCAVFIMFVVLQFGVGDIMMRWPCG